MAYFTPALFAPAALNGYGVHSLNLSLVEVRGAIALAYRIKQLRPDVAPWRGDQLIG